MSQNVIGCTFQWSVWTLVNGSFDSHWAHDPQVENHWSIRRHTCSFIDLRTSRVTAGPSLAGSTWFKSLTTTVVLCWRWGNDAFESFYSCNEGQVSSFEILEFSRNALSLTDHHFLGCVCGGGEPPISWSWRKGSYDPFGLWVCMNLFLFSCMSVITSDVSEKFRQGIN